MKSKLTAMLAILASAMFAVASAQAQDQDEPQQQDEPQIQAQQNAPGPPADAPQQDNNGQGQGTDTSAGVARVSFIHGAVSTQRGDSSDWTAAILNAPIVSGDKISTGDDSRAEVQLDFANILRLSNNAQATIATLTRKQIQVQVAQGIVNYEVFSGTETPAEIDTPNVAIHPANAEGSYRIEVRPSGETEVIVRKGEADISTPQGSTHLAMGQDAIIRGSSTDTQYKTTAAPPSDEWDRWNNDRDHSIQSAKSWSHTDRYYTGTEDLDANGHWGNVPDYGPVWYPDVAPGWAPYRAGRWVWEPYWGWTWVSYESWGWAPYHYGRWFQYGGAWAWWPGPVVGVGFGYPYRPIWAPAYVSFFGFGGGFGFGFGFGSVGWLPLGPCDPFFPWWGGYRGRFAVVDFHHFNNFGGFGGFRPLHGGERFSNLRLAATNEHFRRSISVMSSNHFGTGIGRAEAMRPGQFSQAHMMGGNVPVVPTRASLSASNRVANRSTIHSGAAGHFFGSRPTAHNESFNRQTAQIRQNIQRDSSHFNSAQNGSHGFAGNTARPAGPSMQSHSFNGNGAANNNVPRPNSGAQVNRNAESVRSNTPNNSAPNNGWHSFNSNRPTEPNGGNESFNRSSSMRNNPASMQNNAGMRSNNVPRPSNSTAPQNSDRGGWQHFTPQPRSATPGSSGRSFGNSSYGNSSYGGAYSSGAYSRGGAYSSRPNYEGGSRGYGYSRPPLNMRQPVVTQRSEGSYRGSSGGGYRGSSGGSYHSSGGGGASHSSGGGGGGHSGGGGHR
jgi:hypothetical protein